MRRPERDRPRFECITFDQSEAMDEVASPSVFGPRTKPLARHWRVWLSFGTDLTAAYLGMIVSV